MKDLSTEAKGLFFCKSQADHDQLVKNSKLIVKNILKSARDFTNDKSIYSKIINLLDKDFGSKYSLNEIICIFHIIEYSLTIFVQRLNNDSIKWFNNENGHAIKQISKNLSDTKNILIKEKNLLIDEL